MKQKLVYSLKNPSKKSSKFCGFDLCPHKYKYLGNPQLLQRIFNNPFNVGDEPNSQKKQNFLEPEDMMYTTNCRKCNQELLLQANNPVCTSCRRIMQ